MIGSTFTRDDGTFGRKSIMISRGLSSSCFVILVLTFAIYSAAKGYPDFFYSRNSSRICKYASNDYIVSPLPLFAFFLSSLHTELALPCNNPTIFVLASSSRSPILIISNLLLSVINSASLSSQSSFFRSSDETALLFFFDATLLFCDRTLLCYEPPLLCCDIILLFFNASSPFCEVCCDYALTSCEGDMCFSLRFAGRDGLL